MVMLADKDKIWSKSTPIHFVFGCVLGDTPSVTHKSNIKCTYFNIPGS